MWNLFKSPAKQKHGKWLTFFGGSSISWATISCLWWQYLLLLIFCFSALSLWAHKQTMPASSSTPYKHSENLLKSLHILDEQYSANTIPLWKHQVWKKLKDNVVSDNIRSSLNPKKHHKWSRRFKRDLETYPHSESSSRWASAVSEIFREIFRNNIVSIFSKTVDDKSVATNNVRSSLNLEMDPLSNQNSLHNSKIENKTSVHFPNEETTTFESSSSSESITTLKSLSSEERPSVGPYTKKSMNSTEWKSIFVTDVPEFPTINVSTHMENLTSSLPLLSNSFTKPRDSSNYVNKTPFPNEKNSDSMATTNFEVTTASLPFDSSLTVKFQTSSSLVQPTMGPNAHVYMSGMQSSPGTPSLESPSTLTSLKLQKQTVWRSSPFEFGSVSLTRGALELTSSNTHPVTTEVYQPISTEDRMERSSSEMDSKPFTTLYASHNQYPQVKLSLPATSLTNLQTSDMAQTSERELKLGEQTRTAVPWAMSTWSAPKSFHSTEENYVSSDMSLETDYKIPSNVTLKKPCVLQPPTATMKQTPFKLSETSSFFTTLKLNTYEMDNVTSESKNVTLDGETQSYGSALASTVFTNMQSTETDFLTTVTLPPFAHERFNDGLSENENLNHSTFKLTSTQSSKTDSVRLSESGTLVSQQRKSVTSQYFTSASKAPQHFNVTKDHRTPSYLPSSLNVSPSTAKEQKYPSSTTMSLWQNTPFMKSTAQTPIKSSYYQSITTHGVSTKMFSTGKHTMSQQTTVTHSKVQTLYSSSPKANVTTSSLSQWTPETRSSTRTMTSSIFKLPHSTVWTYGQPSFSKAFMPRSKIITSTPDLNLVIPQSSTDSPAQPTNPINHSVTPTHPLVVKVPVNFHITGVVYSKQLSNHSSDAYKRLKREVKLVMNKIFSTKYLQEYVATEIAEFLNGSVIVRSNVVFNSILPTPDGSDIVRTVLTDVYGTKMNYFGWNINGSTVESKGYTEKNLKSENLPISFLVLRAGFITVAQNLQEKQSFMENLQKQVFQMVNTSFPILKVGFSQIRDVHGDLEVRGTLFLNSPVRTNVQALLSTLLPLVNYYVDISSIIVDGMHSDLHVHIIQFRIINKEFVVSLLDMSSPESQKLSKDLSTLVQSALRESNPVQVIIREFKSGSIVCKGDLLYRLPAPGSGEILRLLMNTLGSNGILGSSSYTVDSKTVTVGDSSPGPYNEYVGFPGFGVAIIVMCGLFILIFPTLVYTCYKTRMLGHRKRATIQQPQNPDNRSHHFEMDNQAFRASIEQP